MKIQTLTLKALGFGDLASSSNQPRHRVTSKALEYAKKELKIINVKPGEFKGNQKCYQNARGVLEFQSKGSVVASCIAFLPDGRGANFHFVNKIDGHYVDNTLGYQANFITYFLIKEYTKDELDNYSKWKIYPQILDDLQNKYLNMWFAEEELKEFGIGREHF